MSNNFSFIVATNDNEAADATTVNAGLNGVLDSLGYEGSFVGAFHILSQLTIMMSLLDELEEATGRVIPKEATLTQRVGAYIAAISSSQMEALSRLDDSIVGHYSTKASNKETQNA